ncbi:MAG: Nif11-like leader peptide family natural product precursor [Desulfarculaceae bacterium]|nr:Nif11-like leader peptide family natural product precursor [Desulfarculaceae bacterium]MCF8049556.1 Nif11-like leader peptide family natural product precursor [Desulfarculaceae bacterium]MCF8099944.1 Nif11-like leader peptide family natural product precursor [Desulfarculaceae bacterium]
MSDTDAVMTDAARFVDRMREDQGFRQEIIHIRDEQALLATLRDAGFSFDRLELVRAMAECMNGMEAE